MDGSDKELFPFLPYILQDTWEIGASPETIIRLINKHFDNCAGLKVLDLCCGKGAVSVKVSESLGCYCHGIDAIREFAEFASQRACEFNVGHLCTFETGDIREKVKGISGYDVIILGATGPVLGDYYHTLTTLSECINKNGIFIIDDGYIDDDSNFIHPLMFKKKSVLQQINNAGMEVIEEEIMKEEEVRDSGEFIFNNLKKRCFELIEKYPDKQNLFLGYIKKQEEENDVLENKVIASTLVIKAKNVK